MTAESDARMNAYTPAQRAELERKARETVAIGKDPSPTADSVALANHETVHWMTMNGMDNEERITSFRAAFSDILPESELTDRQIVSAMCGVELRFYP